MEVTTTQKQFKMVVSGLEKSGSEDCCFFVFVFLFPPPT